MSFLTHMKRLPTFYCVKSFSTENVSPKLKRILSGVQPTGALHLGNYLGAIRQWVKNQELYESYFMVVDLHAITAPYDPKKLRRETLQAAAMYLASEIDPNKSQVFIQSHVKAHAELTWLLNCITPKSWLELMIQYKEKSKQHGDEAVNVGLFDYPVLMAADILLYQADLVPVGEDQRQHLELTRDICRRFNDKYSKNNKNKRIFKEPQPLIVKEGARIMSLNDGTKKMSKSAELDSSRINLLDTPEQINSKIKRSKTDSISGIEWGNPDRPEANNLVTMYQAVTGKTADEVLKDITGLKWGTFKPLLSDAVISHLTPIQQRYHEIIKDETYLDTVLFNGQQQAETVAQQTLHTVKEVMGFHIPAAAAVTIRNKTI